jgi:hypothetical protein
LLKKDNKAELQFIEELKATVRGLGFNDATYLELNPDVAEAGVDPLIHYVKSGRLR